MCTAHGLMRLCHLINRSFVCKAKERRHIRNCNIYKQFMDIYVFFYWNTRFISMECGYMYEYLFENDSILQSYRSFGNFSNKHQNKK